MYLTKSGKNSNNTLKIIILIALFSVFCICAVLFSGRAFEYKTQMNEAYELYMLSPYETLTQQIVPAGGRIDGVSVAFSSYGRINTGKLKVALCEDGNPVRNADIEASYLSDNAYQDLRFNRSLKTSAGHSYSIALTYESDDPENTLAVWTSYSGSALSASGSSVSGRTLCYQMILVNGSLRLTAVCIIILLALAGFIFFVKTGDINKISIPKSVAVTVISILALEVVSADLMCKTELNINMPVRTGTNTVETIEPGMSLEYPFEISYSPVNSLCFAIGDGDYDNIDIKLINNNTSAVYAERHVEVDEIVQDYSSGMTAVSLSAGRCGTDKFPLGLYTVKLTNTSAEKDLSVVTVLYEDGTTGIFNTQTQFTWMTRIIAFVIVTVLAVYLFLIFRFSNNNPIKTENLFLMTALPLGAVYFVLFQPWSAPDTMAHFQAVYRISNTVLGHNANNGWMISTTDSAFYENVWRMASSYPDSGSMAGLFNNLGAGSSKDMIVFKDPMDQMEYYTIISYLPMVIGFVIAKLFNLSTAAMLSTGRLLMLVFYITVCYRSVKVTPVGKTVFAAVCLLPMSLMMSSSLSYDAMVIVTTVAFTANVLRLRDRSDLKCLIETCVWSFFIGGVKGGGYLYLIVLLIVLWKKNERETSLKKIIAVAVSGIFAAVFFNMLVPKIKLYQFGSEGNAKLTTMWGVTHPVEYINMCAAAFLDYADNLLINIGGTVLSWDEFSIQNVAIAVLMFTAFIASVFETDDTLLDRKDKAAFVLGCLIAFCCTPLMLLSWTDANSVRVEGLQGRYFLPVLPLILMIFSKFNLKKAAGETAGKAVNTVLIKCQRAFAAVSVICVYYLLRLYLTR